MRRRRRKACFDQRVAPDDHPFIGHSFGNQISEAVSRCSAVLRLSRTIGITLCVQIEKWCAGVLRAMLKLRGLLTPFQHSEIVQKTLVVVQKANACLEEVVESGRLRQHLKRHLFTPRLENTNQRFYELFTAWTTLFPREETAAIEEFIDATYSTATSTRDAQVRDLQERRFCAELEQQLNELRKTIIYGSEQQRKHQRKLSLQRKDLRRRLQGLSIDTLGKVFESTHIHIRAFEQSHTPATEDILKVLRRPPQSLTRESDGEVRSRAHAFPVWKVKQNKILVATKIAEICQDTTAQVIQELSARDSSPLRFDMGKITSSDLIGQSKLVYVALKKSWKRCSTPAPARDVENPSWAFDEFQKRVCSELEIEKIDNLVNLSRGGANVESLSDFSGGDRLQADCTRSQLLTKISRLGADLRIDDIATEALFYLDSRELLAICFSVLEEAVRALDLSAKEVSVVPIACKVDHIVGQGVTSLLMSSGWPENGEVVATALHCLSTVLKGRPDAQLRVLRARGSAYLLEVAKVYHQSCPMAVANACNCLALLSFHPNSKGQLEDVCRYLPSILLSCPIKRIFGDAHIAGCVCIASLAKNGKRRASLLLQNQATSYLSTAITRLPREQRLYIASCKGLANTAAQLEKEECLEHVQECLKGYKTVMYSIKRFQTDDMTAHGLNFLISIISCLGSHSEEIVAQDCVAYIFSLLREIDSDDVAWRALFVVYQLCIAKPTFLVQSLVEANPFVTLQKHVSEASSEAHKWLYPALRSLVETCSEHEVLYLAGGTTTAFGNDKQRDYQLLSLKKALREQLSGSYVVDLVQQRLMVLEDPIAAREALSFCVATVQVQPKLFTDILERVVEAVAALFSRFLGYSYVLLNALDFVHCLVCHLLQQDTRSLQWDCFINSRILDHLEALKVGEKDRNTQIYMISSCLQNTIKRAHHDKN